MPRTCTVGVSFLTTDLALQHQAMLGMEWKVLSLSFHTWYYGVVRGKMTSSSCAYSVLGLTVLDSGHQRGEQMGRRAPRTEGDRVSERQE